jgi:quercetin dioxygenase-like cupin family protein
MGPEAIVSQAAAWDTPKPRNRREAMNQTNKTIHQRRRMTLAAAAAVILGIAALPAGASTSVTIGSGTMDYSEAIDGPATVTMRTLTISPGEVLGWHHHPGTGAYTVVVSGMLTIEDGCGGEAVYSQGQAFLEPPGRVHRGKNLTGADVVTAQTFIVPLGTPISVSHAQRMCGVPTKVEECKNERWRSFNLPRYFMSQGDCMDFVITGE